MLLEEGPGVLATLSEPHVVAVGVPGAGPSHHAHFFSQIDQQALPADAVVEHDVELALAERRRTLVLHHLYPDPIPDVLVPLLDRGDPPDVEPEGGVELESPSARRRLWIPEHHADLLANLVREDHGRFGASDGTREFSQGLGHEPCLEPHVRIAHLSLDLRTRDQGRHRVDNDHVQSARSNQRLRDLQRLLPRIGLRDQEVLDIHAELGGVSYVQGMFDIHERREAATALGVGDHVEGESRLPRRLRPEDLGHPPPWNPADAGGVVETERPGGDRENIQLGTIGTKPHDGALPVRTLDLIDRHGQRLLFILAEF